MKKLIGKCPVDSGTLMLVDPCYVLRDTTRSKDENEALPTYNDAVLHDWGTHTKISGRVPGFDLGTIVSSGYGDGCYPVYADIEGGTVRSVTVVFDEDEPEYDDEDEQDEEDDY